MITKINVDRDWHVQERMARLDHTLVECEFCNTQYQLGSTWQRLKHWWICSTIKKVAGKKTKDVFILRDEWRWR